LRPTLLGGLGGEVETDLVGLKDVAADGDATSVTICFRGESGSVADSSRRRTVDRAYSQPHHYHQQVTDIGDVRDRLKSVVHYHVLQQHHQPLPAVPFCSLTILDPRVGHTLDVLSRFISVLCHSDRHFHGESCPRIDVVHPGRAWSSSPACTWHCSLHYLFLQATPLFPYGVS